MARSKEKSENIGREQKNAYEEYAHSQRTSGMRVLKNFGIAPLLTHPVFQSDRNAGGMPFNPMHSSQSPHFQHAQMGGPYNPYNSPNVGIQPGMPQYQIVGLQALQTQFNAQNSFNLLTQLNTAICLVEVKKLEEVLKLVKTFQHHYSDVVLSMPFAYDDNSLESKNVKAVIERLNPALAELYNDWISLFDWINNTSYFRNVDNDLPLSAKTIVRDLGLVDEAMFVSIYTGMADLRKIVTPNPQSENLPQEVIIPWSTSEISNLLAAACHMAVLHGQLARTFIEKKGHPCEPSSTTATTTQGSSASTISASTTI